MNHLLSNRRPVAEAQLLETGLAQLDATQPGWDEDVRIDGAVRRLSRDSTAQGVSAAISVYGHQTVRAAAARLGIAQVLDQV